MSAALNEVIQSLRYRQGRFVNTLGWSTVNTLYLEVGRGGQIRTDDPLHPMQVRYRAALRPDGTYYTIIFSHDQNGWI